MPSHFYLINECKIIVWVLYLNSNPMRQEFLKDLSCDLDFEFSVYRTHGYTYIVEFWLWAIQTMSALIIIIKKNTAQMYTMFLKFRQGNKTIIVIFICCVEHSLFGNTLRLSILRCMCACVRVWFHFKCFARKI